MGTTHTSRALSVLVPKRMTLGLGFRSRNLLLYAGQGEPRMSGVGLSDELKLEKP
jgi:hypothetical protein